MFKNNNDGSLVTFKVYNDVGHVDLVLLGASSL